MKKKNFGGGIVYSTQKNFAYSVTPHQSASVSPDQQNLFVYIDRKNRGGKSVTVVSGFAGRESDLEDLARLLKTRCGVGGSVKDGLILIQGDHRDNVCGILSEKGFPARKA